MKSKTIIFTIIIITLFGCSLESKSGSLPIVLPRSLTEFESNSRELSRAVEYDYEIARIYLKSDTGYYNIDDSTNEVYKDIPYSVGSYVITGLNPGKIYEIFVLFGSVDNGILHSTMHYGYSRPITITAGINNKVEVNLDVAEVTWENNYITKNVKQLINIGGTINSYTGDGEVLIDGSVRNTEVTNITSIGKGKKLDGSDILWINTNDGIYPYENSADMTFSSALTDTGLSIDESAGIEFTKTSGETMILAYFQGTGTIGGTQIENGETPSEWFGKNDLIENMPEMEDMVNEVDKIIYDFVSFGKYAYVATALPFAPFLVDGNVIDDYDNLEKTEDSDIPTFEQLKSLVTFLEVYDSNIEQVTIKSVTAIEDTKLYLGSDNGIYVANINSDGTIKDGEDINDDGKIDITTLVSGTFNKKILKLEANDSSYVGAITKDGVLIIKDNSVVKEFKFYMGLPENISDIAWVGNTIYISGSSGVVFYNVSNL